MTQAQVPEKLQAFSAYLNGSEFLGVADVTLPSFEAMTSTVSGGGIAGEIESPTPGHFGSMTVVLNWRTIERNAARLNSPVAHAIDFRGSQQALDKVSGTYISVPVKVSVRAIPKKFDLGKLATNSTTDGSNELEVIYIKLVIAGQILIELDKVNYIYKVNGTDYMQDQRTNLGL